MRKTMKKVIVIGGGTGNFVVLSSLKDYDFDLTAIVSMADDGGSTGILRDELGVLPPGDVRQCLVALSKSSTLMRNLINYRFEEGTFAGHSFGNLLLSALEKVTGSFEQAVEAAGKILRIKGRVIPVTTTKTRLKMLLTNGKLLNGEREVNASHEIEQGYEKIYLEPAAKADQHAIEAILSADIILLGPGGLYTSLIPNLLVHGIADAIKNAHARKILIANLMNKRGHTTSFTIQSYVAELVKFIGGDIFDIILLNNGTPKRSLIEVYKKEGELLSASSNDSRIIREDLLSDEIKEAQTKDLILNRNLIRHDSKKLGMALIKIIDNLQP